MVLLLASHYLLISCWLLMIIWLFSIISDHFLIICCIQWLFFMICWFLFYFIFWSHWLFQFKIILLQNPDFFANKLQSGGLPGIFFNKPTKTIIFGVFCHKLEKKRSASILQFWNTQSTRQQHLEWRAGDEGESPADSLQHKLCQAHHVSVSWLRR